MHFTMYVVQSVYGVRIWEMTSDKHYAIAKMRRINSQNRENGTRERVHIGKLIRE